MTTQPPAGGPVPALTARDIEQKFALCKEVIGSLERAMRTRKLYEPDHDLFEEATDDLVTRFQAFFDRFSYLRVEVKPERLLFEGKMLMQAPARDPEIPFRLYKDGIREIRFHRGLTRDEVLDFVGVLEMETRDVHEMGEDFVSLLWTKDFRSIDYAAIDEFEPGQGSQLVGLDPDRAEQARAIQQSADQIVVQISSQAVGAGTAAGLYEEDLALPAEAKRTATGPPPKAELDPARLEAAFTAPIAATADLLRQEIESETLGGAIRRSLEILVRLYSGKEKAGVTDIAPLLRGVVGFYSRKGDFAALGHMLVKVRESNLIHGMGGGERVWEDMVGEIRRAATGPVLARYLNTSFPDDYEGLTKFFNLGGAGLVRAVCAAYPRVTNSRTRNALQQYLLEFGAAGPPEAFRDLLASSEKVLAEALEMIAIIKPPGVHADLEFYLRSPNLATRIQAITAAARSPGADRIKLLGRLLDDPDAKIRTHVLRTVADSGDAAMRVTLEKWIRDRKFVDRDAPEKSLALTAYAMIGREWVFYHLREIAEARPPLFNKQKVSEMRRAAVMALSTIDFPGAKAYIKLGCASGDAELAQFCQEAARMMPKGKA